MRVIAASPHFAAHVPKQTRSSANAEGPRDAPQIRNIALEKACNRGMTFKTLKIITVAAIR